MNLTYNPDRLDELPGCSVIPYLDSIFDAESYIWSPESLTIGRRSYGEGYEVSGDQIALFKAGVRQQ